MLVDEAAAAAVAAGALHEQAAAAATGAAAPAVFGPRGGTRIQLSSGQRLASVGRLPRPGLPAHLLAIPGSRRGHCPDGGRGTGQSHPLQVPGLALGAGPALCARPPGSAAGWAWPEERAGKGCP